MLTQEFHVFDSILIDKTYNPPPSSFSTMSPGSHYTIPVVFHLIGTAANALTYTDIQGALANLNLSFANGKLSTEPSATDAQVNFCLAQYTYNGDPWSSFGGTNTEPGITRYTGPVAQEIAQHLVYRNHPCIVPPWHQPVDLLNLTAYGWPASQYISIYVVETIHSISFPFPYLGGCTGVGFPPDIGGFASLPSFSTSPDLIAVRTTGLNNGVLVHEMGHYLGLFHTFHGQCTEVILGNCQTQGDRCCDTPPVGLLMGNLGAPTCISSPLFNSCNESPDFDDMLSNYMDYSDVNCTNTFTQHQCNRMHTAINYYRTNLVAPSNAVFTGISIPGSGCAYSNFSSEFVMMNGGTTQIVGGGCTNQPFDFLTTYDPSYTYDWTFTGASIGTSNSHNPTGVIFYGAGNHTVTLTIFDGILTVTTVKTFVFSDCTPILSERGNWFFGYDMVDFSSGIGIRPPSYVSNPQFIALHASASQSDNNGSILFYTDGVHVYYKNGGNHLILPTGLNALNAQVNGVTPVMWAIRNNQNIVIVPKPGSSGEYFIYTTTDYGTIQQGVSQYHINTNVYPPQLTNPANPIFPTENYVIQDELIVIPHDDGLNYWLVCKGVSNNLNPSQATIGTISDPENYYFSYLITASGISNTPVRSLTPIQTFTKPFIMNGVRQFSNSPDKKLVCHSPTGISDVYLFYFDNINGHLNYLQPIYNASAGMHSFSPNSRFFYTGVGGNYRQYDLQNISLCNDPLPFVEFIGPTNLYIPPTGNAKLGPDNRIYINDNGYGTNKTLGTIHFPDNLLTPSNNEIGYVENGVSLLYYPFFSLPNDMVADPGPTDNTFTFQNCDCGLVAFASKKSGINFTWNFGDGTSAVSGVNIEIPNCTHNGRTFGNYEYPLHIYQNPGTYVVTLQVDGNPVISHTVVITTPPPLPPQINVPVICSGGNLNNIALSTPPIYAAYNWQSQNSSPTNGNSFNFMTSFTSLPSCVQLMIQDASGCINSNSADINYTNLPTISLSTDCMIPGTITVNTNATGVTTYSLNGGLNQLSNVFTGVSAGVHTVVVTDGNGCSNSSTILITGAPVVTAATTNSIICFGQSITLTGGGALTYSWSGGVINGIPFTPIATASYTVTGTDANGCTATSSIAITVNPLPVVTASASPSSICVGQSSSLTGSGALTYVWNPGGVGSPISVTPAATANYVVTGTDANGCSASASTTVTVYPIPTFTITATNTCASVTNPAVINPSPTGTYTYSILPIGSFTITTPGTYTVTATFSGCSSTQSITFADCATCPQATPGAIWLTNPISSVQFPSGITPSNPIVINGTLTIDNNLQILNNPNVFFAPNSQVVLDNGKTFTVSNTTLKGCHQMWKGITADHITESVIISNGSILRDMTDGVVIANGASLNCQNNTFIDNNFGIQFINTPSGYVTAGTNKGIVLKNLFTSSGSNLLPPLNTQQKSEIGIYTFKCTEVQIGELIAGSNNIFENMYTGIFNWPEINKSQSFWSYNNKFRNIKNNYTGSFPDGSLLNSFYTTHRGAGIMGTDAGGSYLPYRTMYIESVTDDGSFIECDKAIVSGNISTFVKNNQIEECKGGVLLDRAAGQTYLVDGNNMIDVFTGVQIIGDPARADIINQQSNNGGIQLSTLGLTTGVNNYQEWPVAVDIKFTSNLHTGNVTIARNHITIPGIGGRGIALGLTGRNVHAQDNIIDFTTSDASIYTGANRPNLIGLLAFGASQSKFNCNTINGITNPAWGIRNSQGIWLYESRRMQLECNFVNFTHHGLLGYGNCVTEKNAIRGNLFFNHLWGALTVFSVFGFEGNFSDIGDNTASGQFDNHNLFWGMYVNPSNYQVYRYYLATPQFNIIHTNQLLNSGSNFPGFEYGINPTPNPFDCANSLVCEGIGSPIELTQDLLDIEFAFDIAGDSMVYPLFPEVSEWVAQRSLYSDLENDSLARLSNSLFTNFYNTMSAATIGDIYRTDIALMELNDSVSFTDSMLFNSKWQQAVTRNNSISSVENYELNDQWINALQLKTLVQGYDILSTLEIQQLETLAKSCPSMEGTAVYKARTIYAHYEPALTYDDFDICGSTTSNKHGESVFTEVQNFLNQTTMYSFDNTSQSPIPNLSKEVFSLYPNPAEDELNIKYYYPDGISRVLLVYDPLGREVLRVGLNPQSNHINTSINHLAPGLYTYSVYSDKGKSNTGKLLIRR